MCYKYRITLSIYAFLAFALPAFAATSFTDISDSHPNAQAIRYVLQQGIVSGYPDGTFKPNNVINRAEFTKIVTLYKFGREMVDMCGSRMQFTDVLRGVWYEKYVCRARDSHLIEGYPDSTFRPANYINFAEAAKIIVLAEVFNDPDNDFSQAIDPWYERYVRYLTERNAIPISINSLDKNITRSEMAEIIFRLKTKNTNLDSVTYNQLIDRINLTAEDWTHYKYLEHGFMISLPSSYAVSSSTVHTYPDGKQWFRVEGQDIYAPEQPYFIIEVNPDGYGPFFPDRTITLVEKADGGVRNVSSNGTVAHLDGQTLVNVNPLESRNGNTYTMRWRLNVDESQYDAYVKTLYKIFSSISLTPPLMRMGS